MLNGDQFARLYGTNTPAQNHAVAEAASIMENEATDDVTWETDRLDRMEPEVTHHPREVEEQEEWVGRLESRAAEFGRDFNRADQIETLQKQFHGPSGFGPDSYRGKQMTLPGI